MDHAYIEEHQVVDRYLMEKMSPVEAARFEAHYLHCEQCLAELKIAETFVGELKRTVAQEATRATGVGLGMLSWLIRPRRYGLLAAVLLVVLCLPLGLRFQHRLDEERQTREALAEELASAYRPQANTVVFPLHRERSGRSGISKEPSHRIRLGATPEWIVLSLQLNGSELAERYRVSLVDERQKTVWQSEDFSPDRLGVLSVSAHSSWLAAGTYRLKVTAVSAAGQVDGAEQIFSFNILTSS